MKQILLFTIFAAAGAGAAPAAVSLDSLAQAEATVAYGDLNLATRSGMEARR